MDLLPVNEDESLVSLWLSLETGHSEIRKTHFWNMAMTCFPVWHLGNLTGVPCGPSDDIREVLRAQLPKDFHLPPKPPNPERCPVVLLEERRTVMRGGGRSPCAAQAASGDASDVT